MCIRDRQSTNEELIASNEELQSTNEELHSVNEELHTVNAEYGKKINELAELNEDIERLHGASSIGTIFLDSDLNIRRFSDASRTHFDLMPHDIGRPLSNFSNRLGMSNLFEVVEEVSESRSSYSKFHEDDTGNMTLVKITSCMLSDGGRGIAINMVGQSSNAPEDCGYWEWPDVKANDMWWSPRCAELLGEPPGSFEQTYTQWRSRVHPDDVSKLRQAGAPECEFVRNGFLRLRMLCGDGEYRPFEFRGLFEFDTDGHPKYMRGSFALSDVEPNKSRVDAEG